jgi:hypothetical protein
MKFHMPSYLLGVASAAAFSSVAKRFRPVVVESVALGQVLVQTGRALIERQRENVEDLWAEISARVQEKLHQPKTTNGRASTSSSPTSSTSYTA